MIEVKLETVQMSLVSPHRIVVLKELDMERYLPIWIGPCEAEAISVRLNGIEMPRPLTQARMFAVPRSIPMSDETAPKTLDSTIRSASPSSGPSLFCSFPGDTSGCFRGAPSALFFVRCHGRRGATPAGPHGR